MRIRVAAICLVLWGVSFREARADTTLSLTDAFVPVSFDDLLSQTFRFETSTPFQFQFADAFTAGDDFTVMVSFVDPADENVFRTVGLEDALTDDDDGPRDEDMMDMWNLKTPVQLASGPPVEDFDQAFNDPGFYRGAVNYAPKQMTLFLITFGLQSNGNGQGDFGTNNTDQQFAGIRLLAVQEPASLAMACLGSAAALVLRRRSRKS
jgi:hypothetical protein